MSEPVMVDSNREERKRRVERSTSEDLRENQRHRAETEDETVTNPERLALKEPLTSGELEFPESLSGPVEADSEDGHYQFQQIGDNLTPRFRILARLGQGTFGRVLECWDRRTRRHVAIKISRSLRKYRWAACVEMTVISALQDSEAWDRQTIQLIDWFDYRGHICLVLPLLGPTLYDVVRRNVGRPIHIEIVKRYMKQIFKNLEFIHGQGVVHTDVKLENLVFDDVAFRARPEFRKTPRLANVFPATDKLTAIDFGSAVFADKHHPKVISTRHYRAPEIVLQIDWGYSCDIWSAGCILVELLMGKILFRTNEDLEHLAMIEQLIGPLPEHIAEKSSFAVESQMVDPTSWKLNWPQGAPADSAVHVQMIPKLNHFFTMRQNPSISLELKEVLTDLMLKIFCWDPEERMTASDVLRHPFFAESNVE